MLPVRPLVELHIAKETFNCLAIISKQLTLLSRLLHTFFPVVRACFFMFNSASNVFLLFGYTGMFCVPVAPLCCGVRYTRHRSYYY